MSYPMHLLTVCEVYDGVVSDCYSLAGAGIRIVVHHLGGSLPIERFWGQTPTTAVSHLSMSIYNI
jgi:hypothetical protein